MLLKKHCSMITSEEIRKYLETKDNENTILEDLWNAT